MSFEASGQARGRFLLIVGGLCIVVMLAAWSIQDSRQAQSTDKARHNIVMELARHIEKNQASIQQNQAILQAGLDANAKWRDEMRPLIVRMTAVLERVEPMLQRKPGSE